MTAATDNNPDDVDGWAFLIAVGAVEQEKHLKLLLGERFADSAEADDTMAAAMAQLAQTHPGFVADYRRGAEPKPEPVPDESGARIVALRADMPTCLSGAEGRRRLVLSRIVWGTISWLWGRRKSLFEIRARQFAFTAILCLCAGYAIRHAVANHDAAEAARRAHHDALVKSAALEGVRERALLAVVRLRQGWHEPPAQMKRFWLTHERGVRSVLSGSGIVQSDIASAMAALPRRADAASRNGDRMLVFALPVSAAGRGSYGRGNLLIGAAISLPDRSFIVLARNSDGTFDAIDGSSLPTRHARTNHPVTRNCPRRAKSPAPMQAHGGATRVALGTVVQQTGDDGSNGALTIVDRLRLGPRPVAIIRDGTLGQYGNLLYRKLGATLKRDDQVTFSVVSVIAPSNDRAWATTHQRASEVLRTIQEMLFPVSPSIQVVTDPAVLKDEVRVVAVDAVASGPAEKKGSGNPVIEQ